MSTNISPNVSSNLASPFVRDVAAYEPPNTPLGPILAAADASPESDAALGMAQLLATHTGAAAQIISVLRPYASSMYAYDVVPVPLESEATARARREAEVRAQVTRTQVAATTWPVVVETGDPAHVLTRVARSCDARVIVTGRGRHHLLGRMLGGELLPRLLQVGDVPIFAVEPTLQHLPRRVVMAMDFSEQSLYAAQVALGFVAPDALITLVHVAPRTRDWDSVTRASDDVYQRQARTSLAQVRESLERPELRFGEMLLSGKPAEALIAYATDNAADLIVSATHGYGVVRRAMLGSVASTLVRGAPCSVLCVPGSAHSAATAYARRVTSGQTRVLAPEEFDHELSQFGARNQRRLCTVELHVNDTASLTLGHGLPLVGATFDRSSRDVALMFGASELLGQHLTHAVAGVHGIELACDMHGRDVILRLLHDDGTTLVELD